MNIFYGKVIFLICTFSAGAERAHDTDDNFVPVTQRPLQYFPQPRIVGGQDAQENEYPHQISLRLFNNHICGGSIISAMYVLTAAHCVSLGSGDSMQKMPVELLSIRAGSRNVNAGGVVAGVSKVIIHPKYKNFNNDIAVIKLDTPLVFRQSIKAIPLASENPKPNVTVVTSGWGRLQTNGASPQILQYNYLVTLSYSECVESIGYIPKSLICLGHTAGYGVCSGDSGGPAIFNNQLIGVTNFVVGGCGSDAPDGYASVAYFASWIRSVADIK